MDPVGLATSKAAGVLCDSVGTAGVVDATVVVMATALGAIVWTSDAQDITALAAASGARPAVVARSV